MTVYNNTIINCGWRRSKNKKGGSVWVEKAAKPVFVNNLIYDSRFGLKQPKKDGADMEHSRLTPNYYFASTETGVAQMGEGCRARHLVGYRYQEQRGRSAQSSLQEFQAERQDEHQLRN